VHGDVSVESGNEVVNSRQVKGRRVPKVRNLQALQEIVNATLNKKRTDVLLS
jgi:hypothetical protein